MIIIIRRITTAYPALLLLCLAGCAVQAAAPAAPTQAPAAEIQAPVSPKQAPAPVFSVAQLSAKLLEHASAPEETAANLQSAQSWRQQQKIEQIQKSRLESARAVLEQLTIAKQIEDLQSQQEQVGNANKNQHKTADKPTLALQLASIYVGRDGQYKAIVYSPAGRLVLLPGYWVEDLQVIDIKQNGILLANDSRQVHLYLN